MTQPETLMTIGEMAERLAAVDGSYSAPYLARQIRNLVQRGILEPYSYHGEGRTAAAMFNTTGLCHARLLGVLARMGVPSETLLSARRCMENIDTAALSERGIHSYVPGVPEVVKRLKAGERWFFVGHIVHREGGLRVEVGGVGLGSFTPTPDFSNSLIQSQAAIGIVLDCMMLLGPLVMTPEEFERAYAGCCGAAEDEV